MSVSSDINSPDCDTTLYYQNVRGLKTKINHFYINACSSEFDVICLTETGLSPDVNSAELFGPGYTVFRKDRSFDICDLTRGGGVLIAVKSSLSPIAVSLPNTFDPIIDIVVVKVKLAMNKSLFLLTTYIPPSISCDNYVHFMEFLCTLDCFLNNAVCALVGDFNSPFFTANGVDRKAASLRNFTDFTNLNQYNGIANKDGRHLDLVFSNILCDVTADSLPLVGVDLYHPPLDIQFTITNVRQKVFRANSNGFHFNFRKADYVNLYQHLCTINWGEFMTSDNIDAVCSAFYSKLDEIFSMHVPLSSRNRTFHYPPWFTVEVINWLKSKRRAFRLYKKHGSLIHYIEFKRLRALTKRLTSQSYKEYILMIQRQIRSNPDKFWAFVKQKRCRSRIPGEVTFNNNKYSTPIDILDAFASFFSSAFIDSNTPSSTFKCNIPNPLNVNISRVTSDEVIAACRKLKNKFTAGIDAIPAFLVKDCATVFAQPLAYLFNLCIQNGQFPNLWKEARVSPVHKKGDYSDVSNYRPISILCNFSKVLEIILYNKIYCQVCNNTSLAQHGFMKGRSTLTNLVQFTQFSLSALDAGEQVDVIYFDFHHAFDTIDHHILIHKLEMLGFEPKLVELLRSYIIGRSQHVSFGGFKSASYSVCSGIPQGSNLGPLLFVLFIDELPNYINNKVLMYADDVKIFRIIRDVYDSISLQRDIDLLHSWSDRNRLQLSLNKCKVVSYSNKNNVLLTQYSIKDTTIERVDTVKDLGVIFDIKLSFTEHYKYIVAKASKITGFLIRNSSVFDIECTKLLYFSYVRSIVEYCSVVWSPTDQCHIQSIEKVQRRFMKYLSYKCDGAYPPRRYPEEQLIRRFKMQALAVRRKTSAISLLYKVIHCLVDTPDLLADVRIHVPSKNFRRFQTFYLPKCRTNYMKKTPIFFMCSSYNSLEVTNDIFHDSHKVIINKLRQLI